MNRLLVFEVTVCLSLSLVVAGCGRRVTAEEDGAAGTGPLPTEVESDFDPGNFKVDHPEQFPLVTAGDHLCSSELNVTGVVNPDVSRQVPVISTSTGRVVEIDARVGDTVKKGQLLFKVRSSDIAGAFADYRKAVKNEQLAKIQLDRAQTLFDHGAIAKSALEVAQTSEDNAKVDLETTAERVRHLGADVNNPSGIVDVYAPVSGVITDQQITNAAAVQAFAPPNAFTISDLSRVWIICDVYENDLPQVHPGEYADIRLNAYPDRVLKGRIALLGPILDPNIRTAKVRLEVQNPGLMRLGMFVTAAFHGLSTEKHATVPSKAILHLHDREWVYTPAENGAFRRVQVVAANTLPGEMQEIVSGISPGVQVVADALVLQNTVEK